MLGMYLTGMLVAFFVGLIKVHSLFTTANSIRFKNLNQINIFYNPSTNNPAYEKPARWKYIAVSMDYLLLGPIFSWITVILFLWNIIGHLISKTPTPERVKEIQFKLGSAILQKSEVIKLLRDLEEYSGGKSELLDEIEAESNTISETDDIGGYFEFKIMPGSKTYKIYAHSPDYDLQYWGNYEYKIDGYEVLIRLTETRHENLGENGEFYKVKDGVVLESDIRRNYGAKGWLIADIEEDLDGLRKEIEWQNLKQNEHKYHILSKHPELISPNEFKKYLRLEKERLYQGIEKHKSFISNHKDILKTDGGDLDFLFKDAISDDIHKQVRDEYQAFMKKNNLDWHELNDSDKTFKIVETYLNK